MARKATILVLFGLLVTSFGNYCKCKIITGQKPVKHLWKNNLDDCCAVAGATECKPDKPAEAKATPCPKPLAMESQRVSSSPDSRRAHVKSLSPLPKPVVHISEAPPVVLPKPVVHAPPVPDAPPAVLPRSVSPGAEPIVPGTPSSCDGKTPEASGGEYEYKKIPIMRCGKKTDKAYALMLEDKWVAAKTSRKGDKGDKYNAWMVTVDNMHDITKATDFLADVRAACLADAVEFEEEDAPSDAREIKGINKMKMMIGNVEVMGGPLATAEGHRNVYRSLKTFEVAIVETCNPPPPDTLKAAKKFQALTAWRSGESMKKWVSMNVVMTRYNHLLDEDLRSLNFDLNLNEDHAGSFFLGCDPSAIRQSTLSETMQNQLNVGTPIKYIYPEKFGPSTGPLSRLFGATPLVNTFLPAAEIFMGDQAAAHPSVVVWIAILLQNTACWQGYGNGAYGPTSSWCDKNSMIPTPKVNMCTFRDLIKRQDLAGWDLIGLKEELLIQTVKDTMSCGVKDKDGCQRTWLGRIEQLLAPEDPDPDPEAGASISLDCKQLSHEDSVPAPAEDCQNGISVVLEARGANDAYRPYSPQAADADTVAEAFGLLFEKTQA